MEKGDISRRSFIGAGAAALAGTSGTSGTSGVGPLEICNF